MASGCAICREAKTLLKETRIHQEQSLYCKQVAGLRCGDRLNALGKNSGNPVHVAKKAYALPVRFEPADEVCVNQGLFSTVVDTSSKVSEVPNMPLTQQNIWRSGLKRGAEVRNSPDGRNNSPRIYLHSEVVLS